MKYIYNYRIFYDKIKTQSILEKTEMLFESKIAPTYVESDKELLTDSSEDEKSKIEKLIKKHFNQDIDIDNITKPKEKSSYENTEDIENEGENPENVKNKGESKNEGAVLLSITIASLIPVVMEAVGSLSNLLKRKFGINLSEDQIKKLKYYNYAITAYNKIIKNGSAKFEGVDYNWKNWNQLGLKLSKLTGNESVEFGKGDEFLNHKHIKSKEINKKDNYKDGLEDKQKLKNESESPKVTGTKDDTKLIEIEIDKLKIIRDKLFGTSFSNWLKEKGHELHHAYTKPIRLALFGMAKLTNKNSKLRDEKFREKMANVIYSITMVSLSGIGIWQSISHLNGLSEVSNIILKGIEGGVNTTEIRKQALTSLMNS
jgi:hypothetical protein